MNELEQIQVYLFVHDTDNNDSLSFLSLQNLFSLMLSRLYPL